MCYKLLLELEVKGCVLTNVIRLGKRSVVGKILSRLYLRKHEVQNDDTCT